MTQITYIEHDGNTLEVEIANGTTLMQGAADNMVEGVVAECGGAGACATCHVYVDDTWAHKLSPPEALEKDMIECVIDQQANSRLSCQVVVSNELNGLVVRIPAAQY